MDDLDRFVPNVHFEKIPIKNLVSNQDYQRNLSQAHIEKTAENFDIFCKFRPNGVVFSLWAVYVFRFKRCGSFG